MKTLSDLKLMTVKQMDVLIREMAEESGALIRSSNIQPARIKFSKFEAIMTYMMFTDHYIFEVTFDEPRGTIPYRFNLRRVANLLGCPIYVDRNGKAYETIRYHALNPRIVPCELIYFMVFVVLVGDGENTIPWLKGVKAS